MLKNVIDEPALETFIAGAARRGSCAISRANKFASLTSNEKGPPKGQP
jgi:hypothetical protein